MQLDQPGNTVNVDVPPLLDLKPGAVAVAPVAPPPGQSGPAVLTGPVAPPPPVEVTSPRPWQLPLAVTATVLGVGGMAAGVAVGFMGKSSKDQSNAPGGGCNAMNQCTAAGMALRTDALNKGNIGTGVFVAGAVLGAGAVVLWVTLPRSHPATTGAAGIVSHPGGRPRAPSDVPSPQIGLGPTGAALRGAF